MSPGIWADIDDYSVLRNYNDECPRGEDHHFGRSVNSTHFGALVRHGKQRLFPNRPAVGGLIRIVFQSIHQAEKSLSLDDASRTRQQKSQSHGIRAVGVFNNRPPPASEQTGSRRTLHLRRPHLQ